MWSPTHIQVTVHRARGLLTKGKNGTNNCFVTIGLGKEKYQTSVIDKADVNVDWHEECELSIPEKGNRAELTLTCLHRNNLGIDEFLGQIILPLHEMDVYERPRPRWFKLQSKPGKEKKKERGELEIRTAFTVKAGSLTDLSKKEKHKSSLGQIASNVGGSLLSIGTLEKRKSLKKFAKSLGSKVHISGKSKKDKKTNEVDSISGSFSSFGTPGSGQFQQRRSAQTADDADPGVISEDEDEFAFENLSHKSSGSSLNYKGYHHPSTVTPQFESMKTGSPVSVKSNPPPILQQPQSIATENQLDTQFSTVKLDDNMKSMTLPKPAKPPRLINEPPKKDEWEEKLYGKYKEMGSNDSLKRRSWDPISRVPLAIPNEEEELRKEKEDRQHTPTSNTAPSSPALADKISTKSNDSSLIQEPKPTPLPRSNTLESINEKGREKKIDKVEKENKFTKKLKNLRKEFGRSDANDDLKHKFGQKQLSERIIIGHENEIMRNNERNTEISPEVFKKYEGKTKEEMMNLAHHLESEVKYQKQKVKELEDYLDNLLLRVMETHPKILQNPYSKATLTKSG